MRARYVRRVTRDHVGSRVSVRRWIEDEDEDGARRPSDVVGRLTDWSESDVLTIVDREGRPTHVPSEDVIASRTLPEHPHLPPEPDRPRGD